MLDICCLDKITKINYKSVQLTSVLDHTFLAEFDVFEGIGILVVCSIDRTTAWLLIWLSVRRMMFSMHYYTSSMLSWRDRNCGYYACKFLVPEIN